MKVSEPGPEPGSSPVASGKKADSPEKVHSAAQQFEGLMIAQMLKSMRESGGGIGATEDAAGSTAIEMAETEFAKALSSQGGLGIAHLVEAGLKSHHAPQPAGPQKLKE